MVSTSATARPASLGDRAVVIGGSLAGLLAARVLADYFRQVTLIERDDLPDAAVPRQGAPQGRHAHGLLGCGQQIMERAFPGLFAELQAAGAAPVDLGWDTGWYQAGVWRARTHTGLIASLQSRPFLEAAMRRRVRALPNVTFTTGAAVSGLQFDAAGTRVVGVAVLQRGTPDPISLAADLVLDAGGRGSRLPQWLVAAGYPAVEELEVKMGVAYTTRFYRRPPGFQANWKMLIIIPQPPHETRMGLLLPMEDDGWMVSLVGWLGDHAPTDEAGFLEFAHSLPVPDVYDAIKDAEPITPIAVHKIPSNQWRRYDKLARHPEGLVVVGDALSSFNPTYGQGMTAAALDVEVLESCLRAQAQRWPGNVWGLADRYRRQVVKAVVTPWMLATLEDFRYPRVTGQRPPPTPVLHWYLGRLYEATEHDLRLVAQFLQVMHMFRSPAALFLPHIVARVLTAPWRYRQARSAPVPAPAPKATSV